MADSQNFDRISTDKTLLRVLTIRYLFGNNQTIPKIILVDEFSLHGHAGFREMILLPVHVALRFILAFLYGGK